MIASSLNIDALAMLTLRLFIGFLFFFQGYDKVFRMGLKTVFETLATAYRNLGFNDSIIKIIVFVTSTFELLGGFLLILGLFTQLSFILLCVDLLIVTIGFSLINPTWDLKDVFPRLLALILYMMLAGSMDHYTIDYFLFR
jgi:putative oxidoreductase